MFITIKYSTYLDNNFLKHNRLLSYTENIFNGEAFCLHSAENSVIITKINNSQL